ncbi:MAG: lysoplasmalogenase [Anaerolineae bacterium]
MSAAIVLAIVAVLTGAAAILTDRRDRDDPHRMHYVLKPLTTLLILLLALLGPADALPGSRLLIVLGLGASVIGDVLLMLPRDRFVAGLGAFAVAQVCYVAAFGGELRASPPLWSFLPYLAYAVLMCRLLTLCSGPLRLPVTVYALLLASMAWLAGARWAQQSSAAGLSGWIGALLFLTSDTLLSLDRFRRPIPRAGMWVLATYYVGQLLIALSA